MSGHSASITLLLLTASGEFPLTSIGPDFIRLRQEHSISPQKAVILMYTDGVPHAWNITTHETNGLNISIRNYDE